VDLPPLRARVGDILQRQAKETPSFTLSHEACQKGAAKGYWVWRYEAGGLASAAYNYHTFQLTPVGMKVFDGDGRPLRGVMAGYMGISLRRPLGLKVIEVTGIADVPFLGPNAKGAEFKWSWDLSGVPQDIAVLLQNPCARGVRYSNATMMVGDSLRWTVNRPLV
jgi:hypothetical protein